jgi:hypothetical protein
VAAGQHQQQPESRGQRRLVDPFGRGRHRENQASELGQFGGIVNGSVCPRLMERLGL